MLQPPESLDAWTEPFIADRFGAACTQAPINVIGLTNPDWSLYSEDCLNINVYAPNVSICTQCDVLWLLLDKQEASTFFCIARKLL